MTANGTWQVPDDYKPQPCASRCPTCGEPCHAPTPDQQRDTAIAARAREELARLEAEVAHSEATAYRYAEAVETVLRILGEEGSIHADTPNATT